MAQASLPPSLRKAIVVSSEHWPNNPCKARAYLTFVTTEFLLDAHPELGPDAEVFADADQTTCEIRVARDVFAPLPTSGKCSLLVHEFWHLAGGTHVDQSGSPWPASDVRSPEFDLYQPTSDCGAVFPGQVDPEPRTCSRRTPEVCRGYRPRRRSVSRGGWSNRVVMTGSRATGIAQR